MTQPWIFIAHYQSKQKLTSTLWRLLYKIATTRRTATYDMGVKLHKLRQGSSIERYINDLDTLARHLELPEQQKIHYFIFWLKPKLEQALLIRQLQTYDDAVIFAKRKHHFADTNCDTQLTDLLQEIHKEVSLKHTGTKQEPYSAPVHNTHTNYFQQNISLLQTDIQSLKDAINTPHTQYAAPLDTNPVTLQQQLSKTKKTSNTCSRWKVLMSILLLLETTEVFEPLTV